MTLKKIDVIIKLIASIAMIVAFLATAYAAIFIEIPESNEKIFYHFMGMVDTGFVGMIVSYFYTKSHAEDPIDTSKKQIEP